MYMSRINHNRARKLLFKIMEENIECWWDQFYNKFGFIKRFIILYHMKKILTIAFILINGLLFSQYQFKEPLEITWLDHYAIDEWIYIEDIELDITLCTTIGYFIKENDQYYVLARTINNIELIDGLMFILKDCTIEIKRFKK